MCNFIAVRDKFFFLLAISKSGLCVCVRVRQAILPCAVFCSFSEYFIKMYLHLNYSSRKNFISYAVCKCETLSTIRFVDLTTTFSPRYFFLSLFLFSHQLYSIHDTVTCYARQFVHFILLLFIQHTHIKLLLQTTLNKLWLKMFGNLFIFKVMFILLRLGHSWVSPCINSHEVRTKGHSSQTKIHWQSSNTNNKWNENSKLNLVKRFNISKHQRLLGIALHHFWPTFATFSVQSNFE